MQRVGRFLCALRGEMPAAQSPLPTDSPSAAHSASLDEHVASLWTGLLSRAESLEEYPAELAIQLSKHFGACTLSVRRPGTDGCGGGAGAVQLVPCSSTSVLVRVTLPSANELRLAAAHSLVEAVLLPWARRLLAGRASSGAVGGGAGAVWTLIGHVMSEEAAAIGGAAHGETRTGGAVAPHVLQWQQLLRVAMDASQTPWDEILRMLESIDAAVATPSSRLAAGELSCPLLDALVTQACRHALGLEGADSEEAARLVVLHCGIGANRAFVGMAWPNPA